MNDAQPEAKALQEVTLEGHAEGLIDLSPGWSPATAGRNPGS